jgi:phosphatidylglycerophosphate synthase
MRVSNPGVRGGSTEQAMAPNVFFDDQLQRLRSGGFRPRALIEFGRQLWRSSRASADARPELRRELRLMRWGGVVASFGVGALSAVSGVSVLPAVALPVLWWLILCAWVSVELGLVRHPITGAPSPRIGPANLMTLYRGWAAAPVLAIGLGVGGPTPLWVVLCIAAGWTDLLDGTVAVRLHHESRLGRLLDPVLDAFFFSAAAVSLAHWGLLPVWLAVVVALRYFLPVAGGLALLFIRGRTVPVQHTPWGQRSTLAIGIALLVTWMSSVLAVPSAVLVGLYVLALATMALALMGLLRRAGAAEAGGAT